MWHFVCCPRETEKCLASSQISLSSVSLLCSFPFQVGQILMPPLFSFSSHPALWERDSYLPLKHCFNQGPVTQKRDPSQKNNKPCHVSRNVIHWELGKTEILMGQGSFPEIKNHPSEWPLHLYFLLPLFPLFVCYYNGFILVFSSSKFETSDLWVKSICCQSCKNQKLLWSPFPENCFCP